MTPAPRTRVLHVITSLAVGGAERIVLSTARGVAPDRFEHMICCFTEPGPLADEARAIGVPVYCLGGFPGLSHPVTFARLVRLVRGLAPAIVHTQLQAPNLYGRVAAWLARVPVVIATEQNVYPHKRRRHIVVERRLAAVTDVLVAVSRGVQQFLAAQLRIDPARIRVVPNGVAPVLESPASVAELRRRVDGAGPVIATVASLTPKKGHEHLLRAVARLRARGVAAAVLLAGDGPLRPQLEALAGELGLAESVQFLGNVPRAGDVLAVADLFVLPSLVEGMPLALLEAMSAGKAAIATSVGGIPEVIQPDVNGLLVPPADETALANAIARLLGSRELRQRFGAEARRTVERGYTEADCLHAIESIYDDALRRKT
jgi:glycosyltransferase involved in cell wall biosynthesis